FSRDSVKAQSGMVEKVILLGRTGGGDKLLAFMNFNKGQTKININTTGKWKLILDSSAKEWMGNGEALPNTINEQTKELILNGESIIIFKAEG
ncbi:MAG TPA: alpha amylase C-terminal domain-containing protein, partial [Ignavibacteriales bacterium]|nr:alpha amylase C-terminal domain-containing protein [Ignavibacteriales bacterium]